MIVTQINPVWLDRDGYIEFLNRGFRGQWDRKAFDWYLRGDFNNRTTDIAVRADGIKVVSGAAYCYRQLVDTAGCMHEVCVMSAGTTLACERGRGHYAALLQTAIQLCRERSCTALLGFVTHDNPSGYGLDQMGAYSIPSYYIFSASRAWRGGHVPPRLRSEAADVDSARMLQSIEPSRPVRFHYARPQDWVRQFIARPNPVRCLRVAHDCRALIESVGDTDRLQWLGGPDHKRTASIAALAQASALAGRRFFMYTMDPRLAESAVRLGLKIRKGFLKLLPIDRSRESFAELAAAPWRLQSGDRM